ncbi:hypothetical protein [Natronococcus wangiae]|nr:hypothetical protein [Natronococcus sp. AD5]
MLELSTGSTVAILAMIVLPVVTLALYWLDRSQNDGYVSVLGRR